MSPYLIPMVAIAVVYLAMVVLNETIGLFRCDRFASSVQKWIAYVWLGVFMLGLAALVTGASLHVPTPEQVAKTPFYQFFLLHAILVVFLAGWWLLSGRPRFSEFLNVQRNDGGEAVLTGLAVGVGGWLVTIAVALLIAGLLTGLGIMPKNLEPSPMIAFLAGMPLWKKIVIVLSAMTVEEAFFRGWLQKRVGVLVSTALFATAHSGLGQPFLLIGVSVISLIIGLTFYRTKNLIPGVIAHGVFDAVQLFVIIPIAFKMGGIGG